MGGDAQRAPLTLRCSPAAHVCEHGSRRLQSTCTEQPRVSLRLGDSCEARAPRGCGPSRLGTPSACPPPIPVQALWHTCPLSQVSLLVTEISILLKHFLKVWLLCANSFFVGFHLISSEICGMPPLLIAEVSVSCMINLTKQEAPKAGPR